MNKHKGSTLDSFLEEEGILEHCEKVAIERLQPKPCLCGCTKIYPYINPENDFYYMGCLNCGNETGQHEEKEGAKKIWNDAIDGKGKIINNKSKLEVLNIRERIDNDRP